jgi:hypothetical protein
MFESEPVCMKQMDLFLYSLPAGSRLWLARFVLTFVAVISQEMFRQAVSHVLHLSFIHDIIIVLITWVVIIITMMRIIIAIAGCCFYF